MSRGGLRPPLHTALQEGNSHEPSGLRYELGGFCICSVGNGPNAPYRQTAPCQKLRSRGPELFYWWLLTVEIFRWGALMG